MILLLGENNLVEEYADNKLKIDMRNDIVYYPEVTVHYTEFKRYIDIIKEEEPPVVTTQNAELIDILLNSDLVFEVITVIMVNGEIKTRILSKDKAKKSREEYGLELR